MSALKDIHINGLVQDCNNPSTLAMELVQSCTYQSIYEIVKWAEKLNKMLAGGVAFH